MRIPNFLLEGAAFLFPSKQAAERTAHGWRQGIVERRPGPGKASSGWGSRPSGGGGANHTLAFSVLPAVRSKWLQSDFRSASISASVRGWSSGGTY